MFALIGSLIAAVIFTAASMLYSHDDKRLAIMGFFLGAMVTLVIICKVWLDAVQPHSKPTPSLRPLTTDSLKVPVFSQGDNRVSFALGDDGITVTLPLLTLEKAPFPWEPVKGMDLPVFVIYVENGILFVDVALADGVAIQRGKLLNVPKGWDANTAEGALEVVDDHRRPVYQMEYVSAGHVVFRGFFFVKSGGAWLIADSMIKAPIGALSTLKPMFKYPSKDFRGVRDN